MYTNSSHKINTEFNICTYDKQTQAAKSTKNSIYVLMINKPKQQNQHRTQYMYTHHKQN